jgi:hypothetical protein
MVTVANQQCFKHPGLDHHHQITKLSHSINAIGPALMTVICVDLVL